MNTNIVFCFYSLSYDSQFLTSWVNLVSHLLKYNIKFIVSHNSNCNAFYAKQLCLGGSVTAGENQKPFQGEINYQYLVFLNGDIIFSVNDFVRLYNKCTTNNLPFLSADVQNRNNKTKTVRDDCHVATHVEFDMVIIKKGVFEKIKYPWFKPHTSKSLKDMDYIDVDICNRLINESGIELLVSDNVKITRKKEVYE